MRFCQSDGTPLVPDEPLDPYKTMMGRSGDSAETIPPPPIPVTPSGPAGHVEEDVLELPSDIDSRRTMVTSEDEIRREMAAYDANEGQVIEIPPLAEAPEPPRFNEPSLSPPSFGDLSATPPSPFSQPDRGREGPAITSPSSPFANSTPPIPSPFSEAKRPPSEFQSPAPPYAEPEPTQATPSINPFDLPRDQQRGQAMAQSDWTPPTPPQSSWQSPGPGQRPMSPPPPPHHGEGVNQTLPIISLVLGIISLCCYISPITGIAALITGYLGLKNIKADPMHFGGKGLAIAGMVTGGVFALLAIIYWIVMVVFYGGLIGLSILGGGQ